MFTIGPRSKHLLCVLLAQIGCIAGGLWVEGQLVVSSVQRAAQDSAWQDLRHQAEKGQPTGATQVTIVDGAWRVQSTPRSSVDTSNSPSLGKQLAWKPVGKKLGDSVLLTGLIQFDQQEQVAVAEPLAGGAYRILHLGSDAVPLSLADVSHSLLWGGVITLLWVCVILGLVIHLIVTRFYDVQVTKCSQLEAQTLSQVQSLQRTRDAIIFGLAKLTEFRDQETGNHLERISAFATRLVLSLRRHPKYRDQITPEFMRMIGVSAVLHDIGKVGVPDAILLKPGPLTPNERAVMQQHARIGDQCITEIERRLGTSNFLRMAGEIALSHHERWDGTGYPDGLSGEAIPLAARVVAVVDVYDALSSRRVYKAPLPHDDCLEIIRSEAGRHFDPVVAEVFLEIEGEIRDIARKYGVDLPSPVPQQPLPRANVARENEDLVAAGAVTDEEIWLPANTV
jgi:putative two-component system response regulator